MTDLTGKLIANSYKDLLTINSSATNEGVDGTLRRVQDGSGTNTALELSQNAAKIYGDVDITGTLDVAAINLNGLDVSAINVVDLSATNINTTNITVNGDGVATSAALTSVEAIISSNIVFVLNAQASVLGVLASLAAVDTNLQSNINQVSAVAAQNTVQTSINAVQIGLAQTSIAANASAILANTSAIALNATAINNVSAALVSTSGVLTTNINTVSAGLSTANVSIAANSSAIAVNSAAITSINGVIGTLASAGTSATLESRIAAVSSTMATSIANSNSAITALSATLESRIDTVSSTMATSISNSNSAITALSATMATSISNSNSAIAALSATMATSIANHLPLAGGTMTGNLILNADPTVDLGAATKQYVDNLTAAGIHFHEAVRFEQPGPVSATYDNGTDGVGATLTNAGTQSILIVDGVTAVNDDRILIYEQVSATQNGVYVVTTIGSPSTNWVLTRSSDTNTAGPGSSTQLDSGSYFFITEGNTGAGESYICNVDTSIVFGTTDITFVQFSSAIQYTAGTNINISNDRIISTSGVPTNAELAAVSATLATSIANVSATLEGRIAAVSALIPTSLTQLGISDGTAGQYLQTDGNNVFTFVSIAAGGGSGTVTNIKAGSNISITEAGTTVTETTTSATIAVTASPTFSSAVITGDLTVDTNTLYVDSANNNVGIGTITPNTLLDVESNTASEIRAVRDGGRSVNIYADGVNAILGYNTGELRIGETTSTISSNFTERMRIDSSGNVGIGITSPSADLHLFKTTGDVGINIQSSATINAKAFINLYGRDGSNVNQIWKIENNAHALTFNDDGTERMRLETDGDLHVDGNVVAYSTTISDKRLKKNIQPIENALWKVSQINGCTFTYLKDDRKSAGLIAQDLEKVLPSAVIEDKAVFHGEEGETYKTVQYDQVIGLLVEAIKELNAKVERLENGSSS